MKKKSLSAKNKIHNKLLSYLKDPIIKKSYKKFEKSMDLYFNKKSLSVAVSGGPDSLALSFFTKYYSLDKNITAFFYIVDHKLRKNSSEEALIVKKRLKKLNINTKILKWRGKKPNSNVQSMARDKRYSLLIDECISDNSKFLLTGHHKSDIYENFFIRLTRGSGLKGLSSFNNTLSNLSSEIKILRPIKDLLKKDLIYVSENVFNFYVLDPSNKKENFKRVRIRNMITEIKKNGLDLKKFNLTLDNLKSANQALEYYSKKNIQNNVTKIDSSSYILKNDFLDNPTEVLIRSFSELLLMIGSLR